ncbi:hypothetical protein POVCU2_0077060 [Plasmodium ovale curtisi]|uniref:Uncharacterized protein n=1 Tax=Plasmodium ovale curtisi TaxID=864141 RepID=A0A1A8WLX5_PLAOA|nr:hypothetical protein POVCU2_0077060 [Plasmodium ovale curtisi]SBT00041.1 hypothetical protein POVCU1_057030 [Plasmodium ovale curtisi]
MNSTLLDNDYFMHANETLDENEHNIDSDHRYTRIYPLCDMTIRYSMYPNLDQLTESDIGFQKETGSTRTITTSASSV